MVGEIRITNRSWLEFLRDLVEFFDTHNASIEHTSRIIAGGFAVVHEADIFCHHLPKPGKTVRLPSRLSAIMQAHTGCRYHSCPPGRISPSEAEPPIFSSRIHIVAGYSNQN